MIRFCNKEVHCIVYEKLDREELLNYFIRDHMDEIICVIENGRYQGRITYYSLISCEDVYDALIEDFVLLNDDIWQKARNYFANYKYNLHEYVFLPVLNNEKQLICFAYEDRDANAEIRMLRELIEIPNALRFADVYPQYKWVKIYDFNELSYFFAKYLEYFGIPVEVSGLMWKNFFKGNICKVPEYECLKIYGEGTEQRRYNWIENLLESVSVEFECIDHIYEMNLKKGIIKDAVFDRNSLMERLREENEVIILGSGPVEQDVYDFFIHNNIDIFCFANERCEEQEHRLFGKKILSSFEIRAICSNPIFINCVSKNSSWGGGKNVDWYDYLGYKRNDGFFYLRDYLEIEKNGLGNVLKQGEVVLAGDAFLCKTVYFYLKNKNVSTLGYVDLLLENQGVQGIPQVNIEDIKKDTVCLLTIPQFLDSRYEPKFAGRRNEMLNCLKENGIDNYTEYFSDANSLIDIEADRQIKYSDTRLMPGRIVLGSIESKSGNVFFRDLLDNHPSILMMFGYDYINNNLFWTCIRLAGEQVEDILPLFWKIYHDEGGQGIYFPKLFNEKMEEFLIKGKKYTSQELFVMFHVAYAYMFGRNIENIHNLVIYWEPHTVSRMVLEEYAKWLGSENVPCDIINVVRNICMRNGSFLKGELKTIGKKKAPLSGSYNIILGCPDVEKKNYSGSKRWVIRFEDLKKYPRKILEAMCNEWGIEWSETLLETTCRGVEDFYDNRVVKVSGFEMQPVYNTYEEYFSEFDRMRLMIMNAPWQKKYGYPYVEALQFTRKELQEILMELSEKDELYFKIESQKVMRSRLRRLRMLEIFGQEPEEFVKIIP